MNMFPNMAEVVPPCAKGRASVQHITVDVEGGRTACYVYGEFRNPSPPGTYATLRLTNDAGESQIMMSDFHYERVTCEEVVRRAHGDVLIAGLGLGMILHPILNIEAVRSVTVIEKFQDVVDLVLPTIPVSEKLQVVLGDICTWKPPRGQRYDVIWFDIWPDIEPTRLPEMTRLHRRFRRRLNRANPECWMESWHRRETRRLARAQKNAERKTSVSPLPAPVGASA
jgi:spermidine synthase